MFFFFNDHTNGVVALTDELADCGTDSRASRSVHREKSAKVAALAGKSLFLWRERHFSLPCQPMGPSLSKQLSV
jgi:hypothetical protein